MPGVELNGCFSLKILGCFDELVVYNKVFEFYFVNICNYLYVYKH